MKNKKKITSPFQAYDIARGTLYIATFPEPQKSRRLQSQLLQRVTTLTTERRHDHDQRKATTLAIAGEQFAQPETGRRIGNIPNITTISSSARDGTDRATGNLIDCLARTVGAQCLCWTPPGRSPSLLEAGKRGWGGGCTGCGARDGRPRHAERSVLLPDALG